ncbi:hypothetical protein [Gemmobacter denitrificans]|uniref:Sulfotransferase family protein n=1 Tax=Gemmobacter denitrificans TaxID=3123040 RepID=A0ABU8C1N0_9RHOB
MAQDILWLGLHKTGTTFLQKSLDLSQDRLQAAGLAWVGLDEFRRRWTRPLMEEGHDGAQPAPAERPAGLPWRLVFDENIIGLVQRGVTARGLYPQAAERALKIARHLDLQRPLLVLGLRGFAGFLPSLYCEALKSTPFQTFRQFLLWPPEAMSWLPLIRRLQAAFPDSALLLYRAEDLSGHEAALLARITGLPPGDFTLLGAPERLGHSHAAIDRLHAMAREGQVSREDVRRVTAELPRGPGQPGYAPWTTGERTLLEALYARDLAHLAALSRIPGSRLQLITPG